METLSLSLKVTITLPIRAKVLVEDGELCIADCYIPQGFGGCSVSQLGDEAQFHILAAVAKQAKEQLADRRDFDVRR